MDRPEVLLILCLLAAVLLAVNALLSWQLLKRMVQSARRPWAKEDAQLEELSRRVADLRDHP